MAKENGKSDLAKQGAFNYTDVMKENWDLLKEAAADSTKEMKQLRAEAEKRNLDETKERIAFHNEIQKKLASLSGHAAKCKFLRGKQSELKKAIIEAKIQDEIWKRENYQRILDEIIIPLLRIHEEELKPQQIKTSKKKIRNQPVKKANAKTALLKPKKTVKQTIEISVDLPKGFSQITIKGAVKEKIMNYFMILSKEKNNVNNDPYMTRQDIVELLNKNFSIFDCKPTGKYFKINLNKNQKIRLRYFIQQFYEKFEANSQGGKRKYVNFLIHNFEVFKNDNPESLYKNMGAAKKPISENLIPITLSSP